MVIAVWMALALVVLFVRGPLFVSVFRPAPDTYPDFIQEWLSAGNYLAGDPIYELQRVAALKHIGRDIPAFDTMLPWNAHPPVAVLVALPYGLINDYAESHLVWNLTTFPLMLLAVWLILRELRVRLQWWHIFPAIIVLLLADPILMQLFYGQLNFLIAFLIVLGWVADRRGYQAAAGLAVGTAVALKLFPGLLLVYFLAARRWRAATWGIATAIAWNLLAVAAFGTDAFVVYVREVIPSLDVFRGVWSNVSVAGYWRRIGFAMGVPAIGSLVGMMCQLAVVAVVARVSWRANTADERDRAYALAVVGMVLASPVAWGHYFVLLVLPLLLLWVRTPTGWGKLAVCGLIIVLALPTWLFAEWGMGLPRAELWLPQLPPTNNPWLCVGALGVFVYALAAVFVLTATTRFNRPVPASV